MTLDAPGWWCLSAAAAAFGLMFIVTLVVHITARLMSNAIETPDGEDV